MAGQGLNNYFKNYGASGEQNLINDLVMESIQIYGVETHYCPRDIIAKYEILTEDAVSLFDASYEIEAYVESVDGFQGEGDFLSRFGLDIRDQVVLAIAHTRFEEEVTENEPSWTRPREGDLIFLPWVESAPQGTKFGALFEIRFVEHEAVFYQLGTLQFYRITLERFVYSDERLDTGNESIDRIEDDYSISQNMQEGYLTTQGGITIIAEDGEDILIDQWKSGMYLDEYDDSEIFQGAEPDFIDFSEIDPFSEGNI